MECAEFLRRLDTEPRAQDPAMLAHREQCAACATAWQHTQVFEGKLLDALNVPVPGRLTERLRAAQGAAERKTRTRRRFGFAIAASLLLAIIAGGATFRYMDAHSLPAMAVAHMLESGEIGAMANTGQVQPRAVDAVFASRDVRLKGQVPADTTYVHPCMVGNQPAVHLVTRYDDQPVVVLYLPHESLAGNKAFERDGWRGREMPLGKGALVVLSNRAQRPNFEAVAKAWKLAIDGAGAADQVTMLWRDDPNRA